MGFEGDRWSGKEWQEHYKEYETPIVIALLVGVAVVIGVYILFQYRKKRS